jgi:hypothetical protein
VSEKSLWSLVDRKPRDMFRLLCNMQLKHPEPKLA